MNTTTTTTAIDRTRLARVVDAITWNEMNFAGAVCQEARVEGEDLALAWPANLRSRAVDELGEASPLLVFVLGLRVMFEQQCWRTENGRLYYYGVWSTLKKVELLALFTDADRATLCSPRFIGSLTKCELVEALCAARFPRESWRAFCAKRNAEYADAAQGAAS